MTTEIGPGCFGDISALNDGVRVDGESTGGEEGVNILRSLCDVSLDIHGETGSLGDGETEVEGDHTRDTAHADEDTPAVVNSGGTTAGLSWAVLDLGLVCSDDDEGDEGGGKVTESNAGEV